MYSPKSYPSAVQLVRDRIIGISPNTHSFREGRSLRNKLTISQLVKEIHYTQLEHALRCVLNSARSWSPSISTLMQSPSFIQFLWHLL